MLVRARSARRVPRTSVERRLLMPVSWPTSSCDSVRRRAAASAVRWESETISWPTTANDTPAAPARAASIWALKERRRVWRLIWSISAPDDAMQRASSVLSLEMRSGVEPPASPLGALEEGDCAEATIGRPAGGPTASSYYGANWLRFSGIRRENRRV